VAGCFWVDHFEGAEKVGDEEVRCVFSLLWNAMCITRVGVRLHTWRWVRGGRKGPRYKGFDARWELGHQLPATICGMG
jgi:hypothetical protein